MTEHIDIAGFVSNFWEELFGSDKIEQSDSFFTLGGTSLAAIKFITAVENKYGANALSPAELYSTPSFASIVALIKKNASY